MLSGKRNVRENEGEEREEGWMTFWVGLRRKAEEMEANGEWQGIDVKC